MAISVTHSNGYFVVDNGSSSLRYPSENIEIMHSGDDIIMSPTNSDSRRAKILKAGYTEFTYPTGSSASEISEKIASLTKAGGLILSQFAKNDSSDFEAIDDYSSASEDFYVEPAAGEVWNISRLMVYIQDSGSFDSGGYGNNGGNPLTNGIQVIHLYDSVEYSLVDGENIKTNGHWARYCHDAVHYNYGAGDEFLTVRWTFSKAGKPLYLDGDRGDRVIIMVNDNHTNLNSHTFLFQGIKLI